MIVDTHSQRTYKKTTKKGKKVSSITIILFNSSCQKKLWYFFLGGKAQRGLGSSYKLFLLPQFTLPFITQECSHSLIKKSKIANVFCSKFTVFSTLDHFVLFLK